MIHGEDGIFCGRPLIALGRILCNILEGKQAHTPVAGRVEIALHKSGIAEVSRAQFCAVSPYIHFVRFNNRVFVIVARILPHYFLRPTYYPLCTNTTNAEPDIMCNGSALTHSMDNQLVLLLILV